ncbi:hypothetical protein LCGC14_1501650, partial [marine sediment metagenome]
PLRNEDQEEIGSIDEAQAMYNNDLENEISPEQLGISHEQEFWAHCSVRHEAVLLNAET